MGGGKSGGTQTQAVPDVSTKTSVGNQLDAPTETLEENDVATDAVDRKKLGTRGLRIPLASNKSSTITPSAASTGFQI